MRTKNAITLITHAIDCTFFHSRKAWIIFLSINIRFRRWFSRHYGVSDEPVSILIMSSFARIEHYWNACVNQHSLKRHRLSMSTVKWKTHHFAMKICWRILDLDVHNLKLGQLNWYLCCNHNFSQHFPWHNWIKMHLTQLAMRLHIFVCYLNSWNWADTAHSPNYFTWNIFDVDYCDYFYLSYSGCCVFARKTASNL